MPTRHEILGGTPFLVPSAVHLTDSFSPSSQHPGLSVEAYLPLSPLQRFYYMVGCIIHDFSPPVNPYFPPVPWCAVPHGGRISCAAGPGDRLCGIRIRVGFQWNCRKLSNSFIPFFGKNSLHILSDYDTFYVVSPGGARPAATIIFPGGDQLNGVCQETAGSGYQR